MPIWEFECPHCFRREERSFLRFEDIQAPTCASCDSWQNTSIIMVRLPAAPSFTLKGAGFHTNDYPHRR